MSDTKETVLEIHLAHLTHNFNYLKSKVAAQVKMLAVVKASGYGSDALVIAKHLEKITNTNFSTTPATDQLF